MVASEESLLPGYLLVNTLVDLGAPTAQATVDGFGTSRAFASYPYPGDTVVAGPGLLKGNGAPPQIPDYPLIVQTSYPSATSASRRTAAKAHATCARASSTKPAHPTARPMRA